MSVGMVQCLWRPGLGHQIWSSCELSRMGPGNLRNLRFPGNLRWVLCRNNTGAPYSWSNLSHPAPHLPSFFLFFSLSVCNKVSLCIGGSWEFTLKPELVSINLPGFRLQARTTIPGLPVFLPQRRHLVTRK